MLEQKNENPFDVADFCIRYENDDLNEGEIIDGFQHLIDSGDAWKLQGHYGRTAFDLIKSGYCHR